MRLWKEFYCGNILTLHTYIHTYILTYIHTHTCMHASCMHACMHTYIHTHICTCVHGRTQTDTHTHTHRHTDRLTHSQPARQTDIHTYMQTEIHTCRQVDRQTETDRDRQRQTDRQKDRQTDRQEQLLVTMPPRWTYMCLPFLAFLHTCTHVCMNTGHAAPLAGKKYTVWHCPVTFSPGQTSHPLFLAASFNSPSRRDLAFLERFTSLRRRNALFWWHQPIWMVINTIYVEIQVLQGCVF